jgi:hypothetical protein
MSNTSSPPSFIAEEFPMSMFDGILGQVAQNVDINNLAQKVGLSPEQVESAVAALASAHTSPGDTASLAASETGLPAEKLSEIVTQIGGEGALGQFATLLQGNEGVLGGLGKMLDRGGDGSIVDDISGLASGLFGKR